jgi:hypothetical protein
MLFEASWRTSLNVKEILPEVLVCVECGDASTAHRLEAAILALKLACDIDGSLMDSVYLTAEPLLAGVKASDLRRLEAEMVYNSTRGDRVKGLSAAASLVDFARKGNDSAAIAKSLINAANSYRINGTFAEAEALLRELIDYSVSHHLVEQASVGMLGIAKLAIAKGDIRLAHQMLAQSKSQPMTIENVRLTSEQYFLEARIALIEGNLDQAVRAYASVQATSPAHSSHSVSRHSSNLAMQILLGVAQGATAEILSPLVFELEATHVTLRSMGLQDFETECLCVGLAAIGRERDATRLLHEYLTQHRRERCPPPPTLAALTSNQFRGYVPAGLREAAASPIAGEASIALS